MVYVEYMETTAATAAKYARYAASFRAQDMEPMTFADWSAAQAASAEMTARYEAR